MMHLHYILWGFFADSSQEASTNFLRMLALASFIVGICYQLWYYRQKNRVYKPQKNKAFEISGHPFFGSLFALIVLQIIVWLLGEREAADWMAIIMFCEFFILTGTLIGILLYKFWTKVRHS